MKYVDAFYKDVNRLLKQLEGINKTLKTKPTDPKALEEKKKLAPFLTKEALQKRKELAEKLDFKALGQTITKQGMKGW